MKDMVRCGTPNPDFQNEGNPLYNILTAVSNYMPEIGYGQGMNFIGNLILFALINQEHSYDESLAFWVFVYVMEIRDYKGLYQVPFPKQLEMLKTLKVYIQEEHREMWHYMKKIWE